MANTTLDNPMRVKDLNKKIETWISRLGEVYVEGQLMEINRRPNGRTSFMTLRDFSAAASIGLSCDPKTLDPNIREGAHVIVHAKPQFWQGRGTLQLRAKEFHEMGEGDLLQRTERVRNELRNEGLFDHRLKQKLPWIPNCVGLITAADSAAERDVLKIAGDRWPANFRTVHARMQGRYALGEVITGLEQLELDPEVDVIIVARGGGSVEDLLPFSDVSLARAVARMKTPVVSAIGHQPDNPILDDVADLRAATPTDAARIVVPSVAEEHRAIFSLYVNARTTVGGFIRRENETLSGFERRITNAPRRGYNNEFEKYDLLQMQLHRNMENWLKDESIRIRQMGRELELLDPTQILDRGYAIVRTDTGKPFRTPADLESVNELHITTSQGMWTFPIRLNQENQ